MPGRAVAIISQHLKALKEKGVIVGERDGTKIIYRLANERIKKVIAELFREE